VTAFLYLSVKQQSITAMDRSYYALLGVSPDATNEDIKAAYRRKLKETHPDVSEREDASERTQRLIEAKAVLTDPDERERYDRLGHDTYVGSTEGSFHSRSPRATSAHGGPSETAQSASTTENGEPTGAQTTETEAAGRTATWYDRANQHVGSPDWTSGDSDEWQAWNINGTYAVRRTDDTFRSILFSSKSLVLLAATFLVYPVLIFGALFPDFPLVARVLVAFCAIFVIAFLQSIPEVGILVFGTWSVILPVVLVTAQISLVSPAGIAVLLAVLFPLGLSALTRLVIRPVRI